MATEYLKRYRDLVKLLESQGWTDLTPGKKSARHLKLKSPAGQLVIMPASPSEYRGWRNSIALLRRNGAVIPH